MLTSDLLRFDIGDRYITPRYIKRRHAKTYLKIAEDLIAIYQAHLGKQRHELESALGEYEAVRMGYKILRGLAKILDGFAEYESADECDYPELRRDLFEFVEAYRPVVRLADLVHRNVKQTVLEKFELEHGAVPDNIYGDLPGHQILKRLEITLSPQGLLRRYNLALAQGVLYRCHKMTVKISDGYKEVFHYLKLAQLMHKIQRDSDGYLVEINGPFSLFRRTQKYGVNLARFLPGLLLAETWQMNALINTEKGERTFFLDQDCGLRSHYKKSNPFDSTVEKAFFHNFSKRKNEWQIEREAEIVDLGDTVLIPDFKLSHPDGQQALLEIVGFWTPEYLQKKIHKLKRAEQENLIVAVNEKLNCAREDFDGPVIFYKTRLKVKDVLSALEGLAVS